MPSYLCSPGMDSLSSHLPSCLLPCSLWHQGALDSCGLPGVPAPCTACLLAQCLQFQNKNALTSAFLSWPRCPLFYALKQYLPRRAWWAVRVLTCLPSLLPVEAGGGGLQVQASHSNSARSGKWGHPVSSLGTCVHIGLKCICVLVTFPSCEETAWPRQVSYLGLLEATVGGKG